MFSALDKPGWDLEHLGLAYLQAALELSGHSVTIMNIAPQCLTINEIVKNILDLNPKFCGFSPTCLTIKDTLKITRDLKQANSTLHICLGGHQASHSTVSLLKKEDSIDSIIRGYGEESIIQLIDALEHNGSLTNVNGLSYTDKNGLLIHNKSVPIKDRFFHDLIPKPSPEAITYKSYGICSTRGCEYSCSFCSTPKFNTIQGIKGLQMREADNVVNQIESLCKMTGLENTCAISFLDDNFVTEKPKSKKRLYEIAKKIKERNMNIIGWFMCRANTFTNNDENLLRLIYEAGFREILLGIESGDENSLRILNKSISMDRNIQAIDLLSKYNFILHLTMIVFQPFSTLNEIRNSANFIHKFMKKKNIVFLTSYCSHFLAFPGTSLHKRIIQENLSTSSDIQYLDPYAYKFKDPKVHRLALHMIELEQYFVPFTYIITDIRNFIGCLNETDHFIEKHLINSLQKKIVEIDDFSYDYFIHALTVAQKTSLTLEKRYTQLFIKNLKKKIEEITLSYSKLKTNVINKNKFLPPILNTRLKLNSQCYGI